MVVVFGLGVVRNDGDVELCGGRSSANGGLGDAGNGRSRGWSRSTPGNVLSTVTRSVSSLSGCSDGGEIAGDVELSVPAVELARGCARR